MSLSYISTIGSNPLYKKSITYFDSIHTCSSSGEVGKEGDEGILYYLPGWKKRYHS